MFAMNKKAVPAGQIDSLIGRGTRIVGDVHFAGGLRVDGEIHGKVLADPGAPSTLVVSETARIEGEIAVAHVIVNGSIVGPLRAADFLEMQSKARITGDVEYAMIEMHQGAVIEGRLLLLAKEPSAAETA
jgi:cytoskeletal protein CcmA (bactofilin family)